MAPTREQRRELDPVWRDLENGLKRALEQKLANPEFHLRIDGKDQETAEAIWSLLTDDEKTVTVVSWVTAHFMSRHPHWTALADPEKRIIT